MKHIDWKFNVPFALGAFWALLTVAKIGLDQSALWGIAALLMMTMFDVLFKGILFRRRTSG